MNFSVLDLNKSVDIEAREDTYWDEDVTPLIAACWNAKSEVALRLIELGANLNSKSKVCDFKSNPHIDFLIFCHLCIS